MNEREGDKGRERERERPKGRIYIIQVMKVNEMFVRKFKKM